MRENERDVRTAYVCVCVLVYIYMSVTEDRLGTPSFIVWTRETDTRLD